MRTWHSLVCNEGFLLWKYPTWGTPRVQFVNIRKMPWSCVKASLIVYVYASTHAWHVIPKVSTQVYKLDRKIWKLFRTRRNGQKKTKCDQFFCPTSDFFDFCKSMFLLSYRYLYQWYMWILFTKPMQKSVTTVCLHCSFARLKNKHIGVLGTNVATISWLHWSPVTGYRNIPASFPCVSMGWAVE